MSSKWDARYAWSGDTVPPPAEVLSRGERWLPDGGTALDLACGRAGNGEWLGARDFEVTAWDSSSVVIDALRARPATRIAHAELRDVIASPPECASFDVIVVVRFLERSLCPAIAAALKPGGVLFYQTFTQGLSNPAYMLGPEELPALFPDLEVLARSEHSASEDGKVEAWLVARRSASGGSSVT